MLAVLPYILYGCPCEISSNVFGLVVNVNDSIIVRFLVRRCYVINE